MRSSSLERRGKIDTSFPLGKHEVESGSTLLALYAHAQKEPRTHGSLWFVMNSSLEEFSVSFLSSVLKLLSF